MWNGLLRGDTAFFTTQKYDDIQVFVIRKFLGKHIWIVQGYQIVTKWKWRTSYFKCLSVSMLVPRAATQNNMSYHQFERHVDILATHISNLSRTNNNFWHWSTQDEPKTSQILWLIFQKKSLVAKTTGRFFPELSHQKKIWFLDRINSVPGARIAIVFAGFPIVHKCITTAVFNCSCSMNFYNGFWGSTT